MGWKTKTLTRIVFWENVSFWMLHFFIGTCWTFNTTVDWFQGEVHPAVRATLLEYLFHTLSVGHVNEARIESNFNKELLSSFIADRLPMLILEQCENQVNFLLEMKHLFTLLLFQACNSWTGKLFGCNVRFLLLLKCLPLHQATPLGLQHC